MGAGTNKWHQNLMQVGGLFRARKSTNLCFKAICGPKAANCGKSLILLVTVLFTGEKWLSILTLLKTGLSRQFCSEKLLQIRKNTF